MLEVSLVDGHIDNGMTDEDIIKALECCMQSTSRDECKELHCPAYMERGCYINKQSTNYEMHLIEGMDEIILDLINRQKAEIEEWKLEQCRILHRCSEQIIEARDEAIKEFAERLKEKTDINEYLINILENADYEIDNLVKEMTESK